VNSPANLHYHLLIIEDDPPLAQTLKSGLEREGYEVTWKNQGDEGVAFACQHHPHLVLLDIRLPDGSGFDFCRQMRQSGVRQPILMITVEREETDKVLGLEMGADDYITKPFSFRELLSRVRAQLRRAYGDLSSAHSTLLLVCDLVIDQARGMVMRNGKIIFLSPIEFRLLVYMAQHPGQILSRSQIIEALWGLPSDYALERAVNVNIHRLRSKIEPDPDNPVYILTTPGLGYSIMEVT
jgi:DNA-binding response OmpR family regulator